jgi:hypothetical protein
MTGWPGLLASRMRCGDHDTHCGGPGRVLAAPGSPAYRAGPPVPVPELIAPAGLLGERGTVSPAGY